MREFIQQQLENEFLSGGAMLMILGVAFASLRKVPGYIISFLHRRLITTVDVNDQDEAFYWVQEWLAQHSYSKRSRLLSITTENSSYAPAGAATPMLKTERYVEEIFNSPSEETTRRQPKIYFTPAPGVHLLRFEGHWIVLYRMREKQQGSTDGRYWREQFVIKTLVRDRQFLRRLILRARSIANPPEEERIGVFMAHYNGWQLLGTRMPRGFDSVILKDSTLNKVIAKTEEFFSNAKWYRERGIPYQMGFLFHGPPGNGKTSTAIALASQFNRDIHLAKTGVSDTSFRQSMSALPQHSILLIEDIDYFLGNREQTMLMDQGNPEPTLTFSGFLNALDGVVGSEGRLLILTSNHPEKLDPALLRPGRVDHKIKFENATEDQARRLFLRFFPGEKERAGEFAAVIRGQFSMADLQKTLLDHRSKPSGALVAIRKAA